MAAPGAFRHLLASAHPPVPRGADLGATATRSVSDCRQSRGSAQRPHEYPSPRTRSHCPEAPQRPAAQADCPSSGTALGGQDSSRELPQSARSADAASRRHHLPAASRRDRPRRDVRLRVLSAWRRGLKTPRTAASFASVALIEHRYRLEAGYLSSRLDRHRAIGGQAPTGVSRAEARRLAWHLPDDFIRRTPSEQAEIIEWVGTTVLSGGTAYSATTRVCQSTVSVSSR